MLTIAPTFDGKRTIPSEAVTQVMCQLLDLKEGEKLMEIGTGSGFQTGYWAGFGVEVHSIELEPWIDSTQVIGECVYLHTRDGRKGLPEHAPFDAIVATCGVEQLPQEWIEQLKPGGRLVVPLGDASCQKLTLFRKQNGELIPERIGAYTRFQMMRDMPKPKAPKYNPKDHD